MNSEKILEVIDIYREYFVEHNNNDLLSHCHGMLDKIEKFVVEGIYNCLILP